jgi:predicted acylesterase/phospholipase RssA
MAYRRAYNRKFGELGAYVAGRWPEATTIKNKAKQVDTLGLALSGGGYRSAIYNYGILKGLFKIGVLDKIDYLSVVSGGSWIGTAFAMSDDLDYFFDEIPDHSNLIEEGFESFLLNPLRVSQELALARKNPNYISNVYGRLLARTFLREHGQASRYKPLFERPMIKDSDRPYIIINGTVYFRPPDSFHVAQECFEMTRLYCGSRSFGYIHAKDLYAREKPIRIRDAVAISGAAVAVHIPAIGSEVAGLGLSRELVNYTKDQSATMAKVADADHLDVADGGFYNNLGIESLINRGCGHIIVVDAEHDPESKGNAQSGQKYSGLRTLLRRYQIPTPFGSGAESVIGQLDRVNEPLHVFEGDDTVPDILYIKLKSWDAFDQQAAVERYNQPSFFGSLFGGGAFTFDPQFSTAKLDYDFAEHRNLSNLGSFVVMEHREQIEAFVAKSV